MRDATNGRRGMKINFLRCRGAAIGAVLLIAAGLAPQACAEDALSPQQKSAVDRQIHDYLVNHPEVLLEALKAAQQKSDQEAAEEARHVIAERRQELLNNSDDLVQGNPKGDVTIVEFFDYRCPYCKEIEPVLDALLLEDRKLRIVYKEFPILGPPSVFASRTALAAKKQGKYAAFHRAMMAAKGNISDETVLKVAASVGLDTEKIKADMGAPEIDRVLKANYELAEALQIQGTPGIIIGDTLIPGAVDIATLRKDIAAARKGS
jgi:protein-disulfide isomerase